MADPFHIQAPDGSLVEFPAGTSDDVIKNVMAKEYPKPEGSGYLKTADDAIRALANGMTFGLADRIAAAAGSATGIGGKSGDYAGNLKSEQTRTDQFAADHPIASIGTNLVGGAVVPLGAIGAAAKGASLLSKSLLAGGTGAVLGGAGGAIGSRDWTDIPQVAKDTAIGAGTGLVLGGAIPGAARIAGSGIEKVANVLSGKAEGMSRGASRHLVDAVSAEGPAAVQSRVAALGDQAMLADAGPALLGKAQGASLNSDEGRSILGNALTARNEGTNQRIMGDVNRALGPAEDPQTVTNAIRQHRTDVDNVAYPAALDNAPAVRTGPLLTQIDGMLPQSVGNEHRALTNLREMLMTTERRPLLDSAGHPQYDNLGRQRWQEVPVNQTDATVLHKVKQELDNVIEYDAPGLGIPAGALTRQQGVLRHLRGQLNETLEGQVPGYMAANRQSAALARRGQAVDLGTQYLGSGKTTASPGRFADEFTRLEPGEQIAFAKGSRGNVERVLGTKSNDLQALRSELQGEGGWNTSKIATVHGQAAADELMGSVERNLKFRDTHNKVVENSQTAQRQAAAAAMKPTPASETPFFGPGSTIVGMASTAAKKAVGGVLHAITRTDPTKSFGEVARVLSAQGPERDRHLSAIVDAISRRKGNAVRAQDFGNRSAVVAALLANGYAQSSPKRRLEAR